MLENPVKRYVTLEGRQWDRLDELARQEGLFGRSAVLRQAIDKL